MNAHMSSSFKGEPLASASGGRHNRRMSQEAPIWWHEAIRNNLQGSQVSSDVFRTFESTTSDGIIYEIHSITKNSSGRGGIFILATVPGWREKADVRTRLGVLTLPIKTLLAEEASKRKIHTEVEIPTEVSSELAELSITTNLDTAVGVSFGRLKDDVFVVELSPIDLDQLRGNFKATTGIDQIRNMIIDNYFSNMSYFRRINFIFDEKVALPLRKIIANEEIKREEEDMLKLLEKEPGVVKIEADLVEHDDDLQREYRLFLGRILSMSSQEDEAALNSELDKWGVLKIVGWFRFYRKQCEEKFRTAP